MLRTCFRWPWAHRKTTIGLLLALAVVLVNVVAYMQARAMTHFTRDGSRTPSPEALSPLEKAAVIVTGVQVPKPTSDLTPDRFGLPFEAHRLPRADEGELAAWFIPHRRPKGLVLLCHGYAACKAALLPEARAFHDPGYGAFLIDFRGCGESSGWEPTIGYREADDVATALAYARGRWSARPVVQYGQSMGSAAILRALAVNGVEADAVVIECPFDRLVTTVGNRFEAMGLPRFPGAELLVFWGGFQHGFDGFAHDPVDYAGGVRRPVLLLHGQLDPRVTPAQAEGIFARFTGRKRFEVFEGVGHRPLLAEDAGRWRRAVGEFLAEVSQGGAN